VVAAYDWDSLVAEPEPVIAGYAAGSHTLGNAIGPGAPTPEEVGTFLTEYAEHRPDAFTPAGRATAAAAAVWVLAYNARCQLSFLNTGGHQPPAPPSTPSPSTARPTSRSTGDRRPTRTAPPTWTGGWRIAALQDQL